MNPWFELSVVLPVIESSSASVLSGNLGQAALEWPRSWFQADKQRDCRWFMERSACERRPFLPLSEPLVFPISSTTAEVDPRIKYLGWEAGETVLRFKNASCTLRENPGLSPSTQPSDSQLPCVTPVLGDLTPSSGLSGYSMHKVHRPDKP